MNEAMKVMISVKCECGDSQDFTAPDSWENRNAIRCDECGEYLITPLMMSGDTLFLSEHVSEISVQFPIGGEDIILTTDFRGDVTETTMCEDTIVTGGPDTPYRRAVDGMESMLMSMWGGRHLSIVATQQMGRILRDALEAAANNLT